MGTEKLFYEFPPISTQQWEEVIRQDIKGADYEKKLIWKTNEGVKVKPYYRFEDIKDLPYWKLFPGEFPFIRGNKYENNNWKIRQDFEINDLNQSNKEALDALKNGASAIGFFLKDETLNKSCFTKLIRDIYPDCIDLNLICKYNPVSLLDFVIDHAQQNKLSPDTLSGSICYDPLAELTASGKWMINEETDLGSLKSLIDKSKSKLPLYRVLSINGSIFQSAGASAVHELTFSLSMACEYLDYLTEMGLTIEDIANRIQFNFSITSNYFIEIAKLRSFRLLWSKILEAYDIKNKNTAKAYIHSTTSTWNMTVYDPYVNILRATTECMSASIGGTDSLTVLPFDMPYKFADNFSNRIARNVQNILKEEAYFDRVADSAAGSYYIESLTDSLAEESWKLFLRLEKEGGYLDSLKKGIVQEEIKTIRNKRLNDILIRRETILGTNQYPNFNEQALGCFEPSYIQVKAQEKASGQIIEPVTSVRGAQVFEELRLQTEKSGVRPKIFMLTIGNLAMRLARSQFSSNFFAIAGFEVIDNNGFSSITEGIDAAFAVNADIVVLCSSDDEYGAYAPEAYQKLENKAVLVVAGSPASQAELEASGIKNFISIKSNILETLKYYQKLLNII